MYPHSPITPSSSSSSQLRLKFVFPAIQPRDPPTTTTTDSTTTPTPNISSSLQKPTSTTLHSLFTISLLTAVTCLLFIFFLFVFLRRTSRTLSFRDLLHHLVSPRGSQSQQGRIQVTNAPNGARGADPSLIRSLPESHFDGSEMGSVDCAVCLCEFEAKDVVKRIPFCGHFFHPKCIEMWLFTHSSCPLCRSAQLFHPLTLSVGESARDKVLFNGEEKLASVVVDTGRPSTYCSD